MRKVLVIGIIILFIGASVVSGYQIHSSPRPLNRGWLYVGGSGPENYSTIQSAINEANSGDTVFVFCGIYYEQIEINKTINLIGENKNSTIIDYNSEGFSTIDIVSTNSVLIKGFTIANSYSVSYYGVNLYSSSNITIIYNNLCSDLGNGIFFENSNNNKILNNSFSVNELGLELSGSNGNIISNNSIYSLSGGIYLSLTCDDNKILTNTIQSHTGDGIVIDGFSNIIMNNNLIGGGGIGGDGIMIDGSNNIVIDNQISNSNKGIVTNSENEILRNNMINNGEQSIVITGNKNIIYDNKVNNTSDVGIEIIGSNNTIFCNTISNNNCAAIAGIYCHDELCTNNLLYHNNLINNDPMNAWDEITNLWYNATIQEGNYWSDFDEPSEGAWDNNSDGIVDSPYNIPGGNNQDFYPLINPFERYRILNIIPEYSEIIEGVHFNVTVKSLIGRVVSNVLVEFNDELKLTNSNGIVQFTAPRVDSDTQFIISATKQLYTGNISVILVIDIPESKSLIFGRIDNVSETRGPVTFDAVKTRVITLQPYSFNLYTSNEKIMIMQGYSGFIGKHFIFATGEAIPLN
jgi:nitrous oxidase accessory protein